MTVSVFGRWKSTKGQLGPPARCPFTLTLFFGWEGSLAKIDYRKKRHPYSNLLEDLVKIFGKYPPIQ